MALSDNLIMTTSETLTSNPNQLPKPHTERRSMGRRTDRVLAVAAAIAFGTTLLHIFGGGPAVAQPILDSSLEDEVRLTAFVVWHLVTVALGFSAVALGLAAAPQRRAGMGPLVAFVSLLWIAFGAVFIVVAASNGGGAHRFFVELGQWIILMPVGMLGLWSLRRHSHSY